MCLLLMSNSDFKLTIYLRFFVHYYFFVWGDGGRGMRGGKTQNDFDKITKIDRKRKHERGKIAKMLRAVLLN